MGPRVTQLVPPVLAQDLVRGDLIVGPQGAVAVGVDEDGLEHVVSKGHVGWELRLVVGAVDGSSGV